jgi:UDP-glucose 4-epimerase
MKTILVTGIAGFLGSHVAERLIANGHRVIGLDDLSGGVEANIPPEVHFFAGDICDEKLVNSIFGHIKIDAVVHCAAFASENLSHNCRLHTYRSIVQGSATLINAAVEFSTELFVSMSSIAVYGHQKPPFYEHLKPEPADPYGAAKLCMELDLKAAHTNFGLNAIVFRPHNIIGTRQSLADLTRNVASIFIRQTLQGKSYTIFGNGLQTRGFSPVSYVAEVIAASIDRPATWNRTYNIGGDDVITVLELAEMIDQLTGRINGAQFLPERKEARHAYSSHERVKQYFPDIVQRQQIRDCLAEMIEDARKSLLPVIKPLPRIEIQKLLNPAWTSQP